MLANGCFVTDSSHRYDDPSGRCRGRLQTKGPTRIGENCWLGRRGCHERRHDRRALRDRRQQRRDEGHRAVLGRGRRAGEVLRKITTSRSEVDDEQAQERSAAARKRRRRPALGRFAITRVPEPRRRGSGPRAKGDRQRVDKLVSLGATLPFPHSSKVWETGWLVA